MATKGYAAPEVEQAYTRARELCQQVGETPQLFPVLLGLLVFYSCAGGVPDGARAGGAVPRLAQSAARPRSPVGGPLSLGQYLVLSWRVCPGPKHLEQGIALYDPQQHRSLAFLSGHDPGGGCLSYAACDPVVLGYPDQALQRSTRHSPWLGAGSPFSLAWPWTMLPASISSAGRRKQPKSGQRQLIALSTEQGFPFLLAIGTISGLGASRAGTRRGGDCADAPGPGRLPGYGGRAGTAIFVLPCWPRRMGKWGRPRKG